MRVRTGKAPRSQSLTRARIEPKTFFANERTFLQVGGPIRKAAMRSRWPLLWAAANAAFCWGPCCGALIAHMQPWGRSPKTPITHPTNPAHTSLLSTPANTRSG